MRRILSLVLTSVIMLTFLTGCISKNGVDDIPSMTVDEVAGSRLAASTNQELEAEIYQYVTDRIVVDGSKLIKVSKTDQQNITNLLTNINIQLSGKGGSTLSENYANYLLLEFAKTPFEWRQSNKDIVGFDPASRLYFVDVTYSTSDIYKYVVPNSRIVIGSPNQEVLKQKRYTDYLSLLDMKSKSDPRYAEYLTAFTTHWGDIESIFSEQQGTSLYTRTRARGSESGGIGKLTYAGLLGDNRLAKGATMTVRYVLKYALNLGEETDLTVAALYLKNYTLNNYEKILGEYKLSDGAALEVLKPFIDNLILSYNKCVEESNDIGLYNLYSDYGTIDKYYEGLSNYAYNSIGGYTYEILERKNNGKEVAVKVNRVNQIRAKGAEMSLPTYDEVLVFNILLSNDDTIKVKDVYLLSSTLIGEPLSVIKNVTGISDQIQYSDVAFSAENKAKVEETLKKFSAIVTNGDYRSDTFLGVVDLGISQGTLNRMVDTIKSISAKEKSMYIISWNTKTNVYCSVTVREVFECNNGNFDTEAVIDLGNRNGVWKVVNYTRTVNIRTASSVLDKENAFTVDVRSETGNLTDITNTDKPTVDVSTPEPVVPTSSPILSEPTPAAPEGEVTPQPPAVTTGPNEGIESTTPPSNSGAGSAGTTEFE